MTRPSSLERLVSRLAGKPWRVLAIALVVTGLSCWGASAIEVRTSRKAMLPQDVDVSIRLNRFLEGYGAASDLIVVVEGAPRPDLEEYASGLARRLEKNENIRSATERVDLLFFLKRAYLLIPPDTLKQFTQVVDELIGVPAQEQLSGWKDAWKRTEAWLDDPTDLSGMDIKTAEESLHLVLFFLEQWVRWLEAPEAPNAIAWNTMLARHGAESMASGYFASHDGNMLFVFVRPSDSSEEFTKVKPFIETVRADAGTLSAEWKQAGRNPPTVGLTGLPAATFEEFKAINRDILFTVLTAAGLIILLILLWLRSVRWALVVFLPMALGVMWNVGLAYLLIGHLTIMTSGFLAILFGLGVDYGIFMSSRIIEERKKEQDLIRAVARGTAASARALLTAGGATVLIFLSLALVEFDGFSELGIVAAAGVGLVLAATFLVQPAMFMLMPPKVKDPGKTPDSEQDATPKQVKVSKALSVSLVLAAIGVAAYGGVAVFGIPFDYDVMSLLPEGSETAHYQRKMLEESDYQGEVIIFTAGSIAEARELAKKAEALESISKVQGITDMFPPDAKARVAQAHHVGVLVDGSEYARQIRKLGPIQLTDEDDDRIGSNLEKITTVVEDSQEQAFAAGRGHLVQPMEQILGALEKIQEHREKNPQQARQRSQLFVQTMVDAGKAGLDVLLAWRDAKELQPNDIPPALRDRFFGSDGTVAFYAFPAGNVYDHQTLQTLMQQVYSVSQEATGFPTTHHAFSKMVVESFRQGTIMAFLVAVFWIGLVLRRLRGLIIGSLPLLIGGGWMMAIMGASGMAFNFANIIGLPLVMGLAVDYGVWFAHRQHEFPEANGWQVARLAGRAILLAAGTTLAGLGAITMASYKGIASMGYAITIGLICCVTAALLVSPAITQLLFRRRS